MFISLSLVVDVTNLGLAIISESIYPKQVARDLANFSSTPLGVICLSLPLVGTSVNQAL
jgi:hypothetical protein